MKMKSAIWRWGRSLVGLALLFSWSLPFGFVFVGFGPGGGFSAEKWCLEMDLTSLVIFMRKIKPNLSHLLGLVWTEGSYGNWTPSLPAVSATSSLIAWWPSQLSWLTMINFTSIQFSLQSPSEQTAKCETWVLGRALLSLVQRSSSAPLPYCYPPLSGEHVYERNGCPPKNSGLTKIRWGALPSCGRTCTTTPSSPSPSFFSPTWWSFIRNNIRAGAKSEKYELGKNVFRGETRKILKKLQHLVKLSDPEKKIRWHVKV